MKALLGSLATILACSVPVVAGPPVTRTGPRPGAGQPTAPAGATAAAAPSGGAAPAAGAPAADPSVVTLPVPGPAEKDHSVLFNPSDFLLGTGDGPRLFNGFWASAEYLLWWTKRDNVPPLVTTGPPSSEGRLGAPGTVVLFGPDSLSDDPRSGGRFTVGFWLNDCRTCGIEASYFFLRDRTENQTFDSSQFPVLARPFFSLNLMQPASELTAFPGLATGSISVTNHNEFQGAELNFVKNCCCQTNCDRGYRVDAYAGFRFLDLDEDLTIAEMLRVLPTVPTFGGDIVQVTDSFATRNRFYGPQLGLSTNLRNGPWVLDLRGKLALGVTHQELDIRGSQIITTPAGVTTVNQGGLLALSSNIGHFSRDEFSVVPELGINIGYQLTPHVGIFMGYTFLYWTDVLRPGEQIDTGLNTNLIPNFQATGSPVAANRPAVLFRESDFWAQGLNFGVEVHW